MDVYWIWLSLLTYVGPVLQKRLLTEFGSPKAIYMASVDELERTPRLTKRALQSIMNSRSLEAAERIMEQCEQNKIKLLPFSNELYPSIAKAAQESPALLYYKGCLKKFTHSIGIVGSRRCTPYGRKAAEDIGELLASQEITLVSGFAKGIDSYAQVSCINHGGYSILFLASGVDVCYPPEQHNLYQKTMANGGVFISQYPPGTKPYPKQFLQRNALISAWANELIVVEAGQKSGALWTADYAKKQGKTIYAVPHSIYSAEGKGSNLLLANGAVPYLGTESIVPNRCIKVASSSPLPHDKDSILSLLSESPVTIPFLVNTLQSTEEEIMDKLFQLEMGAKIIIRGDTVSLY